MLWHHPNPSFRGFSWPTGMQKNDTLIYSPTMTASTGLHKFWPNLKNIHFSPGICTNSSTWHFLNLVSWLCQKEGTSPTWPIWSPRWSCWTQRLTWAGPATASGGSQEFCDTHRSWDFFRRLDPDPEEVVNKSGRRAPLNLVKCFHSTERWAQTIPSSPLVRLEQQDLFPGQ